MFVSEDTAAATHLRQHFEYYRGQVVSSFANCEYIIGKFLIAIQDADQFTGSFAFRVENRLKKFRKVFEDNEGLVNFREYASMHIKCFENVIEDRNDFAHGLARLDVNKREVTIRRIVPRKGDLLNDKIAIYKLDDLEEKIQIFDETCRKIIALILTIDSRYGLGLTSSDGYDTNTWGIHSTVKKN